MGKRRLFSTSYSQIALSFAIAMTIVLIFSFADQTAFACKKEFLLSTRLMMLSAFLIAAAIVLVFITLRKRIDLEALDQNKYLVFASCALFLVTAIGCYYLRFISGWDCGVVYGSAWAIANGGDTTFTSFYFSRYPNNGLLLAIEYWTIRVFQIIASKFGVAITYDQPFFALTIVNCAVFTIAGFLLHRCVNRLCDTLTAWFSWGAFVLLIGLSPWAFVVYTDALGVLFPILELNLIICAKDCDKDIKRYVILAFLSAIGFIGYCIKPQTVLFLIAFLASWFSSLVRGGFKVIRTEINSHFLLKALSCSFGILVSIALFALVTSKPLSYLSIDSEAAYGMPHFAMMGLNEQTNGVYSQDDVDYSGSFVASSERNAGNCRVILNRIIEYGPTGLSRHLAKKQLVNWDDGTFAWNEEGRSSEIEIKTTGSRITDFLWKSINEETPEGPSNAYTINILIRQLVWFVILVFMAVGLFARPQNNDIVLNSTALSILFLLMFELIFEARARYLFTMVPLMLIIASVNLQRASYFLYKLKSC